MRMRPHGFTAWRCAGSGGEDRVGCAERELDEIVSLEVGVIGQTLRDEPWLEERLEIKKIDPARDVIFN